MGDKRIPKQSLFHSCLLVYRGQLAIQSRGRNKTKRQSKQPKLHFASWNVRTLLDTLDRHERRSAIIGRELGRYNIDIAALSETRISGSSEFVEAGAGYTFFTIGQSDGKPRHAGVGFAVRTSLIPQLEEFPKGINPRLMTMKLKLSHGRSAVFISAYAPTMTASDKEKEDFYEQLNNAIAAVPYKHRLFVLGDFNARVGQDYTTWSRIIGRHSVGNENSNGTLLLQSCSQHELVITNTLFQQANKYKTTWMHPRSKHWHMLDYVITRQRDARDVHLTRVMRGTDCWSDHRLVRCTVAMNVCPPKHRHARACRPKLNIRLLKVQDVNYQLQSKLDAALASDPAYLDNVVSVEEEWADIRDTTYQTAAEVLGFKAGRRHQDWFDDQDAEAKALLDMVHNTHLAWMNDKCNMSKKSSYTQARQASQVKLRTMKEKGWACKSKELQDAADQHDLKRFYDGLKAVYGPHKSGSAPVRSEGWLHHDN
jgi:exonuclease III